MWIKNAFILISFVGLFMTLSFGLKAEETIDIVIKTDKGNIYVELYPSRAPITVANFIENIEANLYEGGHFYRAVGSENPPSFEKKNFSVIQGGKDEAKSPRLPIAHETTKVSKISHMEGTLSMARLDPGTADTEFFICIGDNSGLDYGDSDDKGNIIPGYAAFGKVTRGMDVVYQIQAAPTGKRQLSEKEKTWAPDWILPQLLNESVVISHIEIIK